MGYAPCTTTTIQVHGTSIIQGPKELQLAIATVLAMAKKNKQIPQKTTTTTTATTAAK